MLSRFSRTERALHWVHASAFLVMLASGLILYLPVLTNEVGRRPLLKGVHLYTAIAWAAGLVLVVLVGDRRALRAAAREIDVFDTDDRRWLRGARPPQGRFNAGQKVNAILTAAFASLLALSGLFLWLGERNHDLMLPGAGAVHDALTWASLILLTGHLYLAVIHPRTRHSLRGITLGSVDESWAREHHAKWAAAVVSERAPGRSGGAGEPGP